MFTLSRARTYHHGLLSTRNVVVIPYNDFREINVIKPVKTPFSSIVLRILAADTEFNNEKTPLSPFFRAVKAKSDDLYRPDCCIPGKMLTHSANPLAASARFSPAATGLSGE
ncbi:hypothetical protein ACFFJN_08870 [Erwinia mallotivora]|uniref:hypothetical protein n=1 Tax=Erwinia mallotivora TaxID=69222 RepID=UPI0035EBCBCD